MEDSRIKVLHVINSLETGGAENALVRILSSMDLDRFHLAVVSLLKVGPFAERIAKLGIPVFEVNMDIASPSITQVGKLVATVRRFSPSIIQSWMYHSNLAAQLVTSLFARRSRLVWNIRHSLHAFEANKSRTQRLIKLSARLSHLPSRIVYNSMSGASQHEAFGFAPSKSIVIPNGFDPPEFGPKTEFRNRARNALNLPQSSFVIGHVARFDEMKDHETFLRAASFVARRNPRTVFVMVGPNVDSQNERLTSSIDALDLSDRVLMLGERSRAEVDKLIHGFDLLVSSSIAEAFPNSVGEAMASAVPCVATDVGDCRWVIGDTGRVVPPKDPVALASAVQEILEFTTDQRQQLGRRAQQRVLKEFSLGEAVRRYEEMYISLTEDDSILNRQSLSPWLAR